MNARIEVICERIEELLLMEGRHADDVDRIVMKEYSVDRAQAREWRSVVKRRWRESQDAEKLVDKQNQLERMAHDLYRRALGEKDWGQIRELLIELKSDVPATAQAARERLERLAEASAPNIPAATRVLRNLMSLYGMGNTIRLEFGNGKPPG